MVERMKNKYKWHEKSVSSYYCEVETGRIVGQYSVISFSDDVYHARVNNDTLGEYMSEKCARKAIENKIAQLDADEEAWKNHPLSKGVL